MRVAIIGTGFAGLGMAIGLKQAGIDDFVVLEKAADVGGTWRDNTYPGCQCDVPSNLYSFSFEPNPDWSRTFPLQTEIWDYLRDCAHKYGIVPHIRFDHEMLSASWDERDACWRLETSQGPLAAKLLVSGVGALSEPAVPSLPGLDDFTGTIFHSAAWDHDHDLSGERVAVVGTGASAIQLVPEIQRNVREVHVFQRTAPWIVPHPDRGVSRLEQRLFRSLPVTQRLARQAIYWARECLVPGFAFDPRLMRVPARLARRHLRRQVADPELRAKLTPDYTIGCKRILLSDDYYPSLQQPNVELVTDPIRELRARSIVTDDGHEREVDTVIFGTGFHVTDMPVAARIYGRDGRSLEQTWHGSPQAYLGTTIADCPNLFMVLGPNTGLGHTSVVIMIEAQIAYVMDCLRTMDAQGLDAVEVRPEVQAAFNAALQERMRRTVWNTGGCASWYIDENGMNTTLWPSFTWRYRQETRRFALADYAAQARSGGREAAPAAVAAPGR